jgi:deoxyribonuclease V
LGNVSIQYEHSWSPSPEQAVEIQERLATRVRKRCSGIPFHLIAGADCCYSKDDALCAAAVVVWDLETQTQVETKTAGSEVRFPYIPGLLAFREVPVILKALELLTIRPQLLICDGHGVAHPRRFGLASHAGVLIGVPTIGCAKRRLCGSFVEPDAKRGSRSPLTDRGEIIGTVLRTRNGVRPVFVSAGHLIDLPTAERIVLACTLRYRIPEPLRIAHRRAADALQP